MSRMSLSNRRILVTRPAGQAETLCAAISACGGEAVRFPVLQISAPADTRELAAACEALDHFDMAFFVSPNAIQHALGHILARRSWPTGLAVATVGESSARALHERGFDAVIAPLSGFDSESVLALPEFSAQAIQRRRVVIFRGDGGRELLGDRLTELQAYVTYVRCYHRSRPELDPEPIVCMGREGRLDAITLTSSEGVRNFIDMLGSDSVHVLHAVPVFVPHPRIAEFARCGGFSDVVETASGDRGIIDALEARFGH